MNATNFINRRTFLNNTGLSFGSAALLSQLTRADGLVEKYPGLSGFPHHAPKAKRVIFLCMAGGPSHLET
ncbi:MAG: sulfatase, partial [Akkermansiaceae bacterium]